MKPATEATIAQQSWSCIRCSVKVIVKAMTARVINVDPLTIGFGVYIVKSAIFFVFKRPQNWIIKALIQSINTKLVPGEIAISSRKGSLGE